MSPASANERPERRPPRPEHRGDRNENPKGISFVDLVAEDFRTHGRDLLSPGFWAVAVHRFGNLRMAIRPAPLRAPLTVLYRVAFRSVVWFWGIDVPYNAKMGRRVRLGHHGCMHVGAREIGDDVVIRHAATVGLLRRSEPDRKPTIGNGVEIGPGACVLGDIVVGDGSVVCANTVIAEDVPPNTTVLGNPPRFVDRSILKEGRS
jgi:serine O-acetyltransferase